MCTFRRKVVLVQSCREWKVDCCKFYAYVLLMLCFFQIICLVMWLIVLLLLTGVGEEEKG